MKFAKRVRSPLKGGVDVELAEKTLLWGRNGGGKTAVLQALKLGTRGYVDDQEGKDGVSGTAAIARLFPNGGDLSAEVEMSDGTTFSWKSERKKRGGFTKPKPEPKNKPYEVHFPFQAVKALLSGDDKKIRAWLEQKVGCNLSEEDLLALLPPAQQDEARKALSIFPERAPTDLAGRLKNEARTLRAASTRKEKTIDALVEGIPLPLSKQEREELATEKERLWGEASKPGIMSPQDHGALRATIEELAEALEAVQLQIDALPESQEGEEETLLTAQASKALISAHLEKLGDEVCYVCLRKDADIKGAYDRWDSVLAGLGEAGSRRRLQAQYDRGLGEAKTLAARYNDAEVADVSDLMQGHSTLASTLAADGANRKVWRQADALKQEVAGSRASADIFSSLAKTWGKSGKDLLERRKKDFEDLVTCWLPEGEVFSVDLTAGRVGLLVDGVVRTSLSGAEMSRVLLAVLSAEQEDEGSTPSILEPEDRGWDPDTLADVMAALTAAPDQVILMSTVLPSRNVEGWRVIEVGA